MNVKTKEVKLNTFYFLFILFLALHFLHPVLLGTMRLCLFFKVLHINVMLFQCRCKKIFFLKQNRYKSKGLYSAQYIYCENIG